MASVPPAPEPSLEELVCQAADPASTDQERDDAWRWLTPVINRVAAEAAGALHAERWLRDELLKESVGHLHERLSRFDPTLGTFENWLYRVLYNLGATLRRRYRRCHALPAEPDLAPAAPPPVEPDEAAAELARLLARLRRGLDRVAWTPGRQVDYYAVLLLQLRLVLVERYHAGGGGSPGQSGECAAWAERALPWHPAEQARRIRPALPPLADLWQTLSPWLDEPLPRVTLLGRLNEALGAGSRIEHGTYGQWVYRCKAEARRQLDLADWHEHGFACLLDSPPVEDG